MRRKHVQRLLVRAHVELRYLRLHSGRTREGFLRPSKDIQVRRGKVHLGIAHFWNALVESNEAGRILKWQRAQKNGIENAEDRCGGTDAEREGQDSDSGEAG